MSPSLGNTTIFIDDLQHLFIQYLISQISKYKQAAFRLLVKASYNLSISVKMASQQTSLTGTPRPYFWIRRNRDTFVPLIPLDELPDYIRLSGVSVTKNWDDVRQGEMRFVGDHHDHSGKYFTVDVFNQPHTANCSDKAWEPNSSNVDAPSPDRAESVSQAQVIISNVPFHM